MLFSGVPVSRGLVLGRAHVLNKKSFSVSHRHFEPARTEEYLQIFERAAEAALQELRAAMENTTPDSGERMILMTHSAILQDEELIRRIRWSITKKCRIPEYAVDRAFSEFTLPLLSMEEEFAERAADLEDARGRLIRSLKAEEARDLSVPEGPVILVLDELLPSEAALLDRKNVVGVITEKGGYLSHAAILLRSFGIPAVMSCGQDLGAIEEGAQLILNGTAGTVTEPSECGSSPEKGGSAPVETRKGGKGRADDIDRTGLTGPFGGTDTPVSEPGSLEGSKLSIPRHENVSSVTTASGETVTLMVNLGADAAAADLKRVAGCGLFRTEFLFMQHRQMPTEEEQFEAYRHVLQSAGGKPVTLRMLDLGGDKVLPAYDGRKNAAYTDQLRAAYRASVYGKLRIMFPMIRSGADVREVRLFCARIREELRMDGLPFDAQVPVGVMIETLSLADDAETAAQLVDFASIGTNDLVSFLLKKDRAGKAPVKLSAGCVSDAGGSSSMLSPEAGLGASMLSPETSLGASMLSPEAGPGASMLSPETSLGASMLPPEAMEKIRAIAKAFDGTGKPLSVCGEAAGTPEGARRLVDAGIRILSMEEACLDEVYEALRS